MSMTDSDIKFSWYYFCSLASQLKQTEQFVDHSVGVDGALANGKTYSNEFAKILMLAASEFEVIAKALCAESGITLRWNANIITITNGVKQAYPNIGETLVSTPYQSLKPLSNWRIETPSESRRSQLVGLDWWNEHNNVKHDRRVSFASANLENCVWSMASLMVLELYLSQRVLGNLDVISRIRNDYFSCGYGFSYLIATPQVTLPDFPRSTV